MHVTGKCYSYIHNLMTMSASSVTSLFQDHLYTLDVPAIPVLVKIPAIFIWLIQTSGT